jgi:uncharacterized protein (UPF0548 family)
MNVSRNSEFIVVGTICPLTMPNETEILAYGLVVRVGDEPHVATVAYVSLDRHTLTTQSFVTTVPGCDSVTIHCGLWSSLLTSQIADPISEVDQAAMEAVSRYFEDEDLSIEPVPGLDAFMSVVMKLQGPVLNLMLDDGDEDPSQG